MISATNGTGMRISEVFNTEVTVGHLKSVGSAWMDPTLTEHVAIETLHRKEIVSEIQKVADFEPPRMPHGEQPSTRKSPVIERRIADLMWVGGCHDVLRRLTLTRMTKNEFELSVDESGMPVGLGTLIEPFGLSEKAKHGKDPVIFADPRKRHYFPLLLKATMETQVLLTLAGIEAIDLGKTAPFTYDAVEFEREVSGRAGYIVDENQNIITDWANAVNIATVISWALGRRIKNEIDFVVLPGIEWMDRFAEGCGEDLKEAPAVFMARSSWGTGIHRPYLYPLSGKIQEGELDDPSVHDAGAILLLVGQPKVKFIV